MQSMIREQCGYAWTKSDAVKVLRHAPIVVLLGDRCGWRPLPSQVPTILLDAALDRLKSSADGVRQRAIIEQWYQRDDNAVPAQYDLQPREGEFLEAGRWSGIERELVEYLDKATRDLPLRPQERLLFGGSATEQEIAIGAFVPEAGSKVFCFFRSIKGEIVNHIAPCYLDMKGMRIDEDARLNLETLKARLRDLIPSNVHEYEAQWTQTGITLNHIDQLCEDVYQRLSRAILDELDIWQQDDDLENERRVHADFPHERAHIFVGRAAMFEQIEAYIVSESRSAFAILGEPGVGKSALMAKAYEHARTNHPDTVIVCRYIGATRNSSSLPLLLRSMCHELSRAYGKDETVVSNAEESAILEFRNSL